MQQVLLTAIGVGGATVIGALIGFVFKKISQRFSAIVLSFAAGIMLAAAVFGLVLPSIEYGGKYGLIITITGVFAGAFCLTLIDKLYVISDEMIPETHADGYQRGATYALLVGFCLMLVSDVLF